MSHTHSSSFCTYSRYAEATPLRCRMPAGTALTLFPIWLLILDWFLRIALALHVIVRRRPMTATLAWLAFILFVPLIGAPVYFLVGENRLGSRRAAVYDRITTGLGAQAIQLWFDRGHVAENIAPDCAPIAAFGRAVSAMPALHSNSLLLLPDNESVLGALRQDIAAATHHIHLLYYIWSPDAGGESIANALIEARKRGVTVRLLVDDIGSRKFLAHPLRKRMEDAGIQVVGALPARLWRLPLARLDLRNHRKIAVFDGRIAYCGSQNIHDVAYRAYSHRKAGPWVDATVRVHGPAAQALAATFLRDWALDSEELVKDAEPFLPADCIPPDGESTVQVVPSGPGASPQAIHQALLTTIYTARREIVMTTPYFVPDEAMLEALMAAATRGVKVQIVLPRVNDSPLVAAAARSHYLDLLEAGATISEFRGGLLHAKTVTVDRHIAVIGSANMDQRSFFLNFEVTMFVFDDNFASILHTMQQSYQQQSSPVSIDRVRRKPILATLRDNAAQLLGPLL